MRVLRLHRLGLSLGHLPLIITHIDLVRVVIVLCLSIFGYHVDVENLVI